LKVELQGSKSTVEGQARSATVSSRRTFLRQAAGLSGLVAVDAVDPVSRIAAVIDAGSARGEDCGPDPFAGGHLVEMLPLTGRGASGVPLDVTMGAGLDGRRFTDLSALAPDRLVTPSDRFFIRTRVPDGLDGRQWAIRVSGLVREPFAFGLEPLLAERRRFGPVLIECAGNSDPGNFGLMSAARWSGIPIARILDRLPLESRAARVVISGLDRHVGGSTRSVAGASWVFTPDELAEAGAFLAFEMNGAPLAPDHGHPVRLVVPRWYGCASIKWVDELVLVDADARATAQMREFAGRTHQSGVPDLARDFRPATVDLAAMPIRVEKWEVERRPLYRIVGIVWGGDRPVTALQIRVNPGERFEPVRVCPLPESADTWALWSHPWRPASAGRYTLVLKAGDASLRTRRLDLYYYARSVWISDV
jgi:DMSO/TMAO reductase YedYZ molybdopterin-dependent catalytic subunit